MYPALKLAQICSPNKALPRQRFKLTHCSVVLSPEKRLVKVAESFFDGCPCALRNMNEDYLVFVRDHMIYSFQYVLIEDLEEKAVRRLLHCADNLLHRTS